MRGTNAWYQCVVHLLSIHRSPSSKDLRLRITHNVLLILRADLCPDVVGNALQPLLLYRNAHIQQFFVEPVCRCSRGVTVLHDDPLLANSLRYRPAFS
jgi:hypothetical protein